MQNARPMTQKTTFELNAVDVILCCGKNARTAGIRDFEEKLF
jgi:hypothetical protein